MRWRGREGSTNIEDRRRMGGGRAGPVGGLLALVIVLLGLFFGVDVTPLLEGQGGAGGEIAGSQPLSPQDEAAAQFVSVALKDTETVWSDIFASELGRRYSPAVLVLFKGATASACGGASAQTGPFYCPVDKKVYLDTDFFATLQRELGAGGDFAAAYVVAHEIGHHVQDELGILEKVNAVRARSSEAQSNALSVRVELQADCLAGVWARHAAEKLGTLEQGDIAEAMNAASRIGDDTLQRNAGRRPMPDSFTHGTSEQRQRWFAEGYRAGALSACDTFGTDAP
ncbi:MAG: neutral zinc metallopeptidase [Rhodobacteraceae bacterium]|nr:neutral zinc metallopeptidase [Paracoccaceae bacterium]